MIFAAIIKQDLALFACSFKQCFDSCFRMLSNVWVIIQQPKLFTV